METNKLLKLAWGLLDDIDASPMGRTPAVVRSLAERVEELHWQLRDARIALEAAESQINELATSLRDARTARTIRPKQPKTED